MAGIPKNVMQIGQTDPRVKIYMEDYVHTFLERCEGCGPCLAFGRKEETEGVGYYLIYGVEKKQDWDRGSFPYFKNLERIGEIEGKDGGIRFRTLQGREIVLQGYFVFYEQNEDMQSYMIAERESRDAQAQQERERVMEEVQLRREKRRQEAEKQTEREPGGADRGERALAAGGALRKRYLRANAAVSAKKQQKNPGGTGITLAGVCRAGCLGLLLILAAAGLISQERYPDRKAVTRLFSDDGNSSGQKEDSTLIVEEAAASADMRAAADADDIPVQADGKIQWMIGSETADGETVPETEQQSVPEIRSEAEVRSEPEAQSEAKIQPAPEAQSEAEIQPEPEVQSEAKVQSTAAPAAENYTVQKGDSLAEIARRFYGSASYVGRICDLNQIEDPDRITPGQNILLP